MTFKYFILWCLQKGYSYTIYDIEKKGYMAVVLRKNHYKVEQAVNVKLFLENEKLLTEMLNKMDEKFTTHFNWADKRETDYDKEGAE